MLAAQAGGETWWGWTNEDGEGEVVSEQVRIATVNGSEFSVTGSVVLYLST